MRNRLVALGVVLSLVLVGVAGGPTAPAAAVPPGTFGADITLAQDPAEAYVRNTLTITVTNNLPVTLTNVEIDYRYAFDYGTSPAECRQSGFGSSSGQCDIGTLATGQSRTLVFSVIPTWAAQNSVSVAGSGQYCIISPICTTFSFNVTKAFAVHVPRDPVTVEASASPAVTYAGGTADVVIKFTIRNRLAVQARDTQFRFTLPPQDKLPLVDNDDRCPSSPCDVKDLYTPPAGPRAKVMAPGYWYIAGGDSLTLTYVVDPATAGVYQATGTIVGRYQIDGAGCAPTTPCWRDVQHTATATITILEPRVGLSAAITPQPGYVGDDDMTLTYVIHNPMPDEVTSPKLEFTLPNGLQVSGRDPVCPTSPCTKIGRQVSGDVYSLDPGQTVTLTFKIRPSAEGEFTATGAFTGKVCVCEAPVSATTSIPVLVVQSRALTLGVTVVTVVPGMAYLNGDNITVKYTATNTNGHTLYGVFLQAQAPAGLAVVSDPDGCLSAAGCTIPLLGPGGIHEWTVVLAASQAAGGTTTGTVKSTRPTDQATASAPIVVVVPVLTINPEVGPPGFVALARGAQFPPGAKVQLRWSTGLTASGNVVVVDGSGNLAWQALVFPGDVLGKRQLIGVWVEGPKFGQVTVDFLVAPPTWEPPIEDVR